MSRYPHILSATLGLTTIVAVAYAWQLHSALAEADATQTRLARELRQLRFTANESKSHAAPASEAAAPAEETRLAQPPPEASAREAASGRRLARREVLAQSPEVQKLRQLERRDMLDQRFAGLFRKLNLPPDQLEKLKDLLVERDMAATDVYQAARELGLNMRESRDQIQKQVTDAQAAVDEQIRAAIGDGGYQQYQQFEQTSAQRALASQVERRLSYTATPLSADQTDRLVSLLASNQVGGSGGGPAFGPVADFAFGGGSRGLGQLSDTVLDQSRAFLSTAQIDALRQMRDAAAQRAALRQQVQTQIQAARGAGTAGGGPGP